jgi:hypothetical protein
MAEHRLRLSDAEYAELVKVYKVDQTALYPRETLVRLIREAAKKVKA